jgi:hypothetical protein
MDGNKMVTDAFGRPRLIGDKGGPQGKIKRSYQE